MFFRSYVLAVVISTLLFGFIGSEFMTVGVCSAAAFPDDLTFEKVSGEAFAACEAMANRKAKETNSPFDFQFITTLGKLADAYLKRQQKDPARRLLKWSALPESDVERLVQTIAVKFGAEIPKIPESATESERQIWQLDIFLSLAHGNRDEEAVEYLNQFPAKYRNPTFRLRYMKVMAENCLKQGDTSRIKKAASLMWQQTTQLNDDEVEIKIKYLLFLAELSQRAKLESSSAKILSVVDPLLVEHQDRIASAETQYDYFRRLGIAHARDGNSKLAMKHLATAAKLIDTIEDDYFDIKLGKAKLELNLSEAYRIEKQSDKAREHIRNALNWLKKDQENDQSSSIAKSIDGESGFFSTALGIWQNSEFTEVVLEQVKSGDLKIANETWGEMPVSVQKLLCQINVAKHFLESENKEEATKCATRCLKLETPDSHLLDRIAFRATAMHIYQLLGDNQKQDELAKGLLEIVAESKDDTAKQNLASELIALGRHQESYQVIQSIESVAMRAKPLATLAEQLPVLPSDK